MNVQELIDALNTVEDKTQDIMAEGYEELVSLDELIIHPTYGLVIREAD